MLCVSKLLEDPMTADKEIVSFLTGGCGGNCEPVSTATAYRDLASIRRLVGNVQLAGKNWYRYMVIEAAKGRYPHRPGSQRPQRYRRQRGQDR